MRIQGLIIDMDGVLWRGDEPIGNLPRVFNELQRKGLKFILATNNATRSIEGFQSRLEGFGVKIHPHQIINSPVATALYLKKQFPQGGMFLCRVIKLCPRTELRRSFEQIQIGRAVCVDYIGNTYGPEN